MIDLLRNLWIYAVGVVLTVVYAGRITLLSYVWPSRLDDLCDEAPRIWSKGILRISGVDVAVEGQEHIDPERAQIVAANHSSWFDVFALSAYFPGTYHYVAKQELARIPIFGRSWIACEHIAIDRSDHNSAVASLDRAAEKIREDDATIIMFPEGTRSPTGELQRFKKGSFVLALQAGVPVVPVAILGSHEVMPKGAWKVRPGRIRIRIGRPIPVEGLDLTDRDALLAKTRAEVAALLRGGPLAPPAGEQASGRPSPHESADAHDSTRDRGHDTSHDPTHDTSHDRAHDTAHDRAHDTAHDPTHDRGER